MGFNDKFRFYALGLQEDWYILSPFPIVVSIDNIPPFATIHAFRFISMHQCLHTRSSIVSTLDLGLSLGRPQIYP